MTDGVRRQQQYSVSSDPGGMGGGAPSSGSPARSTRGKADGQVLEVNGRQPVSARRPCAPEETGRAALTPSPGGSGRVAAPEELAERIHARFETGLDEALAQGVHLGVVDALGGHAQRAAVVALEPALELPCLAVDEGAAVQGRGEASLDLAGRVELPVDVGGVVVLALPQELED